MRLRAVILLLGFCAFAELGFIAHLVTSKARATSPPTSATPRLDQPSASSEKPVPVSSPFNWNSVESPDYKKYIVNLRAIGCPEATVRDIIIADVDKLLASRNRMVAPKRAARYWEPEEREVTTFLTDDQGRQEQALEKEKRALIKELLGIDSYSERRKLNGDEDMTERRLAFLSEGKREQARALLEKYSELERAFQEKTDGRRGGLTAEDRAEITGLREAHQAELANLLTPREAELYELWSSNAAVATRFALGGMDDSSEREFLAIYNIRKRLDPSPDTLNLDEPATLEALSKTSAQTEEEIRAALGEERYAQYQRGQDHDYRQLIEVARQYHLPEGTAAKIYALKKRVEEASVISDQTANEPDRTALGPIRHEADESVRELLGETAYQHYRRNGNADWLQNN
jgi:hypothetical protein